MKKYTSSLILYAFILLVSLFLIFFVGKNADWERILVGDWLNHFSKGMDIAGGSRLTYKIDLSSYRELYPDEQEYFQVTKEIKNVIIKNIDTRVDGLGVSDFNRRIDSLDDGDYLVIEIWGISDLDQAKSIIGKTVELDFRVEYDGDGDEFAVARKSYAEDLLVESSVSTGSLIDLAIEYEGNNLFYHVYEEKRLAELPALYQNNPESLVLRPNNSIYPTLTTWEYGEEIVFKNWVPTPTNIAWHVITRVLDIQTAPGSWDIVGESLYTLEDILIADTPAWIPARDPESWQILNAAFFQYASVTSSQTGQPVVSIQFNDVWKNLFCNLTWEIIGKQMAIFVGGKMETNPVIRAKICGGSAQIDGDFTGTPCGPEGIPAATHAEGTRCLVDNLNEWALPAPLILSQEEKVSAVLGDSAMTGSLIAAWVGLLAVFLYMVYLYGLRRWLVAISTLIAYLIVLLGLTKLANYAYSLSGIAAILLSIGMWVDANVLIYERMNEERKNNASWIESIETAAEKSRSAIRDGNLTTFMIAFLLFVVGTNVFKWFGTMMMVNILLTIAVIVPLTKRFLILFFQNKED